MPDLLVLGDCNPDILVSGDAVPEFGQREQLVDAIRVVPGGSASIFACAAARLGLDVAFVGAVGDDVLGRFMLDALHELGVDVAHCVVAPAVPTGATVALLRGDDRAQLTARGAMPLLTAEHVPPSLVASARHVHVASYFHNVGLQPGLPTLFDAARRAGATTSVEPQEDPAGEWDHGLLALLPLVDVLFANEQEMRALGALDVELRVEKRGSEGAVAHTRAGTAVAPSLRVDVVDATGAGDAFDAGFVAARLRGDDVETALRTACVCGALSTRAVGGTAALPTWDEVRALL